MRPRLILLLLCVGLAMALDGHVWTAAEASAGPQLAARNKTVLGCWGDADKGDSADLKLYFVSDGLLIQYDENQVATKKRTFGAWEMEEKSGFLTIYWPTGGITRYNIKRIGPILHFSGLNGTNNFTLLKLTLDRCWKPKA